MGGFIKGPSSRVNMPKVDPETGHTSWLGRISKTGHDATTEEFLEMIELRIFDGSHSTLSVHMS